LYQPELQLRTKRKNAKFLQYSSLYLLTPNPALTKFLSPMLSNVSDRIHILLYEEIMSGKYRPYLAKFSSREVLEGMIFEANTTRIAVVGKADDTASFFDTEYCHYGFKSTDDYDIQIKELNSGKKEIYLKPMCSYELREVMDIPQFVSFKCSCFMALMGDEFERIKIRAEKILVSINDVNQLRAYASKHVQKLKKLYHDAKHLLKELQDKKSQDDVYIIFALNLFIIRTIMFYQQLFRPYIKTKEESEEQLMSELIKEVTWRKIYSLFRCSGKGYCDYLKKSYTENTDVSGSTVNEPPADKEKTFSKKESQPAAEGDRAYTRIKINGNTNAFIEMFFQLLETIKINEKTIIETSYKNLEAFMLYSFTDKWGKPLRKHTLNTYLKPYRHDKRPKGENSNRIDVSGFFTEEENPD